VRVGLAIALGLMATAASAQVWRTDQGDGTFRNPVLFADYPDPDIIRVGSDYYFATTTFANTPGITILHSRDLVNWTLVSHLVDRLEGKPEYDLKGGNAYRHGLYASSLRYHAGTYYLANTPVGQKTRIWYAKDVRGPWRYHELEREAFDPGLFIEPDGRAYLATASTADGTITLLTLDKALAHVTASQKVHYIKGAEGSKIIRRGSYYYMFNALPPRLALSVSRSRSLFGPWETRDQIDDKTGGHQGALVDLPDGRWFGFVMEDSGAIGRMTNLSPVFWQDDWPVWGTREAPGRVPRRAAKPIPGGTFAVAVEPQSRAFALVADRAAGVVAVETDGRSRVLERTQYAGAEGAGAGEPGRGEARHSPPSGGGSLRVRDFRAVQREYHGTGWSGWQGDAGDGGDRRYGRWCADGSSRHCAAREG
jgi:beta-xylosidase